MAVRKMEVRRGPETRVMRCLATGMQTGYVNEVFMKGGWEVVEGGEAPVVPPVIPDPVPMYSEDTPNDYKKDEPTPTPSTDANLGYLNRSQLEALARDKYNLKPKIKWTDQELRDAIAAQGAGLTEVLAADEVGDAKNNELT